jgi:CBS domain-containing protein
MSRRDDHLDALLRHLGATYYQTLRGDATARDVARAVEAVADDSGAGSGPPAAVLPQGHAEGKRRVRDVMTANVLAVTPRTSSKHTARLLHENRISAVPVLTPDGKVAGVVSEADLLPHRARPARHRAITLPGRTAKAHARTAGEMMTAPAIIIGPDAPAAAAASLMHRHHLKRLPVVDADGQLIGAVSRHDLLKVFLRPDEQIAADVAGVLTDILLLEPASVAVTVREGVVTLAGQADDPGQIQAAVKLADDVDGVIAVTSKLTSRAGHTWTRPPG